MNIVGQAGATKLRPLGSWPSVHAQVVRFHENHIKTQRANTQTWRDVSKGSDVGDIYIYISEEVFKEVQRKVDNVNRCCSTGKELRTNVVNLPNGNWRAQKKAQTFQGRVCWASRWQLNRRRFHCAISTSSRGALSRQPHRYPECQHSSPSGMCTMIQDRWKAGRVRM
jgi:hypothetical protein